MNIKNIFFKKDTKLTCLMDPDMLQDGSMGTTMANLNADHPISSALMPAAYAGHTGVDTCSDYGAMIYAGYAGIVRVAEYDPVGGNYVIVEHGEYFLYFGHFAQLHVGAGQRVTANTVLGTQGQTGSATGDHLHFQVWHGGLFRYGRLVDPMPWLTGELQQTVAPAPVSSVTADGIYVVESGDTLSDIATQHGTTWEELAQINGLDNPHLIYPGQKIRIPGTASSQTGTMYVVASGDTLSGIAERYGTTYQQIAEDNGIANPNLIYPGQILQIRK